jgi:LPS sulfotransferase NodH
VAGRPEEYFVPSYRDDILRNLQLQNRSAKEYFERFAQASLTPNGVLGLKLHAVQTNYFLERVRQYTDTAPATINAAIAAVFPRVKYIHLYREDKVSQAVSYYKAIMSNEWWRFSETFPASQEYAVPYSQYGIKKALRLLELSDHYWNQYFNMYSIKPLALTFEALVADYETSVRAVLAYLGITYEHAIAEPKTVKQSDEQSVAWAEKFLEDEQLHPAEPFMWERWALP